MLYVQIISVIRDPSKKHKYTLWAECRFFFYFNPLNAELKPICHLLALLGAHHIPHISRIRVKGNCQLGFKTLK